MLIRSTVPVMPLTVTTSPTRIGRSSRRMMPLTKFATISWRPNPRPTPRAASTTPIFSTPRCTDDMAASVPVPSTP